MSKIDELAIELPPPAKPRDCDVDWRVFEQQVGFTFPIDFKELVAAYGAVSVCDLITPIYPTNQSPQEYESSITQRLAEMASEYSGDEPCPVNIYPACPGLFLCAYTSNDDYICWITNPEPSKWGIFVSKRGGNPHYILDGISFSDFLLLLLRDSTNVKGIFSEWHFRGPKRRIYQ